jgi:glycosyltransferase involved in cell wall biosynthesis
VLPVSVIVPFYNSEAYIRRCVEGLLAQCYPAAAFEILLVDNDSSDTSARIVRQYPSIKLLFEGKQGAYAARNRGCREAKGETIAFTDADCIPRPDWLQKLTEPLAEPEVRIVLGSHEYARDSRALSMLAAYENEKYAYAFQCGDPRILYGHANNMAVRRSLLSELGPFSEKLRGSDTSYIRLCVETHGYGSVVYAPQARVRHLEIDGIKVYYRKRFAYAQSQDRYGHISYAKPLNLAQRMAVYRRTVESLGYNPLQAAVLLMLLVPGMACWTAGRLVGAFGRQGV